MDASTPMTRLLELAAGYRGAAVLTAAAELGLFAQLQHGPVSGGDLAERLGCDLRGLTTLANALVALDILAGDADGYALPSPLQPLLADGHPESVLYMLRHHAHQVRRWSVLADVVRSGEPAPRPERDEQSQRDFLRAMDDNARRSAGALWDAVSLAGRRHLLDVGGGSGRFTLAALERNPDLAATVVDRPESELALREVTRGHPAAGRLAFAAADAVTGPLPPGDAVLLSSLVHIYGPADLKVLAATVAAALADGGLLVIRDYLYADTSHTSPPDAALFAVNMLVNTAGGGCYTAGELEALFAPAGFADFRVQPVDRRSSAVLATRRSGSSGAP